MKNQVRTVAIIGGGAAGMMAAARVSELLPDACVILFEKNAALGKKVKISGGGRCNVTTGIQNVRELLKRYERGSKFLTSAMWNFPPATVYDWFEEQGVPLKTEEDMRVFPQSNNGEDVVAVFERLFTEGNVELRLRTAVHEVVKNSTGFSITSSQSGADQRTEYVDAVILTTGGQAYRHTGSTGDGYTFAEALGHSTTPLAASLNAFVLSESWTHALAGVSFEDIILSCPQQTAYTARGPIVFTHRGISGPAVFALSAKIAFEEYSNQQPLELRIDWVPAANQESLRSAIDAACSNEPKKTLVRLLQTWVPRSLAEQLLTSITVSTHTTLAECSKQMRAAVVEALKQCTTHIVGRSAGSEFVTAGGVDTDEIDSSTMQSKITPGLFFAGEIMNVDGVTGGFNLQASWAAGRLAGESVAAFLAS